MSSGIQSRCKFCLQIQMQKSSSSGVTHWPHVCNLGSPAGKIQNSSLCVCLQEKQSTFCKAKCKSLSHSTEVTAPHPAHATSLRAQILCHHRVSDRRVSVQTQLRKYDDDFHTVAEIVQSDLDRVMQSTLKSPGQVPLKRGSSRPPRPGCSSSPLYHHNTLVLIF